MADKQSGRISRRRVLQGIGAAGLTVGVAPFAQAKSAATNGGTPIKRIRGTYDSPLKAAEIAELRRSALHKSRTARMKWMDSKDPIVKPALTEDQRIVEFFITTDRHGTPQYYHGTVSNSLDQSLTTARSLADKREREMQTMSGPNVSKDDDWWDRGTSSRLRVG